LAAVADRRYSAKANWKRYNLFAENALTCLLKMFKPGWSEIYSARIESRNAGRINSIPSFVEKNVESAVLRTNH
jgi:hypothetical protein